MLLFRTSHRLQQLLILRVCNHKSTLHRNTLAFHTQLQSVLCPLYFSLPQMSRMQLRTNSTKKKKQKRNVSHSRGQRLSHCYFLDARMCVCVCATCDPCEYKIILVFDGLLPGQAGQDLGHYAG